MYVCMYVCHLLCQCIIICQCMSMYVNICQCMYTYIYIYIYTIIVHIVLLYHIIIYYVYLAPVYRCAAVRAVHTSKRLAWDNIITCTIAVILLLGFSGLGFYVFMVEGYDVFNCYV